MVAAAGWRSSVHSRTLPLYRPERQRGSGDALCRIPAGRCAPADLRSLTSDLRRGRFIQPDTIVPNPGDPQSLNRYAYAGNNPVRYTDPTGFFSEDEIMKYLGVDTWEEVLAMFEKGDIYEGQWGWLEVLHTAEVGDNVYFVKGQESTDLGANAVAFEGTFVQMNDQLMFINQEGDPVNPATLTQQLEHEGYVVTRPGAGRYGPENELPVRYLERRRQYKHTHVHLKNIIDIPFPQNAFMVEDTAFGFAMYDMSALIVEQGMALCVGSGGLGCIAAAPVFTVAAPGAFGMGLATHWTVLQELEHYGVWERTP